MCVCFLSSNSFYLLSFILQPVDFEEVQKLELGLLIENIAPFVIGSAVQMDVDVHVGEGNPLVTGAGAGVGAGAGAGAGAGVGAETELGVDVELDVGVSVDVGLDLKGEGDIGLDAGLKPEVEAGPGVGPEVGTDVKLKPGPGTKLKPDAPKSYPIKISVNNVPEGPAFIPDTKIVHVSEDPKEAPKDGKIAVFAATDPDTGKTAEDVRFVKLQ